MQQQQTHGASCPPRKASSSNPYIKGRVRTGCLVCRARKVKCDEQRPSCKRCAKSKKKCLYRTPGWQKPPLPKIIHANLQLTGDHVHGGPGSTATAPATATTPTTSPATPPIFTHDGEDTHQEPSLAIQAVETIPSSVSSEPLHTAQMEQRGLVSADGNASSPNDMIASQDHLSESFNHHAHLQHTSTQIYLTLTMDWLLPSETPIQPSFSYFVTDVDVPFLSSFDGLNWQRVKTYVAQLGIRETPVATAILAVQALHRSQINRLPMAHAMSLYQEALTTFETRVGDGSAEFDTILVLAFLICLAVVTLPNEDAPPLKALDGVFETRLRAWLLRGDLSPISWRIGAWLQFLHVTIKRAGGSGLLSKSLSCVLSNDLESPPSLSVLDCDTVPANGLYDNLSAPVFAFYHQLQRISSDVAGISHYHRSRITPEDQAEVADLVAYLRVKLHRLWDARPSALRLPPGQLRDHFCRNIAEPLASLVGVCITAYYTEVVAMNRNLGDPPFATPESMDAMKQIRAVVEAVGSDAARGINPGHLRALYYYAIESPHEEDMRWAVGRLKQIHNPMSRGGFFASLAEALAEAQRIKGRRVTMKAFCYQTFGVPMPFM